MPDVPWIWFERDRSSPACPSLTLTFDSPRQQLRYCLRAIIYAGGNHFTVRFSEQSGGWWRHDGQQAPGVPQPDDIQSEAELLMNGTRFACIYQFIVAMAIEFLLFCIISIFLSLPWPLYIVPLSMVISHVLSVNRLNTYFSS